MRFSVLNQPSQSRELAAVVKRFLRGATKMTTEQRAYGRKPFFHPVLIEICSEDRHQISAFTRDVSPKGVGLLHCEPIETGEIVLVTRFQDDECVRIRVLLEWCLSCGEGWYISGGQFIEMADSE